MLWCITVLVVAVISQSVGFVSYGPSTRSLVTPELAQQGIQTEFNTIDLSHYSPSYSIVVPLVDGSISVNKSEAARLFQGFHQGSFFVEAPENYGIVAIVQVLRLQQVPGNDGTCQNFIKFYDVVSKSATTPPICGVVEAQDLAIIPSSLIGPRFFVSPEGKIGVNLFIFSNTITGEDDVYPDRGAITLELSFTAFPRTEPLNILGVLFNTHMGLCQFMNYDSGTPNYTWIYCPSPAFPDCITLDLFCQRQIECSSGATAADYGTDLIQCSLDAVSSNTTSAYQTLWRLEGGLETKVLKTPLRIEAVRLGVIFIGAILIGIFVAVFVWRLVGSLRCCKLGRKKGPADSHNNNLSLPTIQVDPPCKETNIDEEAAIAAAEKRRHEKRLESAVFIAQQILQAHEDQKRRRMTVARNLKREAGF